MADPVVLYFGGNGHTTWRLHGVRAALQAAASGEEAAERTERAPITSFRIVEAAYPGFEGRPKAPGLDAFLETLAKQAEEVRPTLAFGTGIGGLLLLCLRSQGHLLDVPLCLHAPVLWGLEKRWMPRIVRWGPLRKLLPPLFAARWYQRRFVRKQFITPLAEPDIREFFDGYARCEAFGDLFDWLTPGLLRTLEARFAASAEGAPPCLEHIEIWWGDLDAVVTPAELAITEAALGVTWPLVRFPDWAHYPMIEAPGSFVQALANAVRLAESTTAAGPPT